MDHIKVLKRAWHIVWNYRMLWVFGIIIALTTASGGYNGSGGGNGGGGGNGNFPSPDNFNWPPEGFQWPGTPPQLVTALIVIGIVLACVFVVLIVVAAIAHYVAETALIRMVDRYEDTGEKLGLRQGFRLGWSRAAWRLFLIKLLIGLPTALVFLLLFALTMAPLLLWITKNTVAGVLGTVAAVGMFSLTLFLIIIVSVVLSLLTKFFWRACALEKLGVVEAIRQGFGVVIKHWQDVLIMWLIMIGVRIGWAITMIAAIIVLFPIILLLIVIGGVLGGLPALLVWGVANLFLEGAVPWILAAVVGIPIFALVMSLPFLFLGGLMEVFKSSTWTLTYRELRALEGLEAEPEELPESGENVHVTDQTSVE